MNTETPCASRMDYIYSQTKLLAKKFCTNKSDVDDLVQDTMVKVLDNYGKIPLSDQETFYWLRTVIRNGYINFLRREKKRQRIQCYPPLIQQESSTMAVEISDIFTFLSSLQNTRARHAKSFFLFLRGYKYHEIAELTQVNINTVKGHIFNIRNLITNYSKN